jgi:hypothetical protein
MRTVGSYLFFSFGTFDSYLKALLRKNVLNAAAPFSAYFLQLSVAKKLLKTVQL